MEDDTLYCQCGSEDRDVYTNSTLTDSFEYCRTCKKEYKENALNSETKKDETVQGLQKSINNVIMNSTFKSLTKRHSKGYFSS